LAGGQELLGVRPGQQRLDLGLGRPLDAGQRRRAQPAREPLRGAQPAAR
jgi:hypothetical protein